MNFFDSIFAIPGNYVKEDWQPLPFLAFYPLMVAAFEAVDAPHSPDYNIENTHCQMGNIHWSNKQHG